jgi:transposase
MRHEKASSAAQGLRTPQPASADPLRSAFCAPDHPGTHPPLMSDRGATDQQIVQALDTSLATVGRTRRKYAQVRLPQAILDQPHPGRASKLQGPQQARLVAIACSDPPAGHHRWTLQLLAQELVKQSVVPSIAPETVRQVLKKSRSSPGCKSNGASRR